METFLNKTIRNECVKIDDKTFVDCLLIDCVLEYSGRPVIFERTRFTGCQYVFFGPARGTVYFLQSVGLVSDPEGRWAEVDDQVH